MESKTARLVFSGFTSVFLSLFLPGCASPEYEHTSPYHPGPVIGKTVGTGVGVVAGNVAGVGVGAAEGTVQGFAAPFDPSYHMVRYWRNETTADGRIIQVPYDVLVDKYGRPVDMPAPTGNSLPPSSNGSPTPAK